MQIPKTECPTYRQTEKGTTLMVGGLLRAPLGASGSLPSQNTLKSESLKMPFTAIYSTRRPIVTSKRFRNFILLFLLLVMRRAAGEREEWRSRVAACGRP